MIQLIERKPLRNAQKIFTVAEAEKAAAFHRTLPSYSPTPLVALKNLAGLLGVSDTIAAKGMRVLGNPCGKDGRIQSGESGAVTCGLLYELMRNTKYSEERKLLGLDKDARILCLSTEGATDLTHYPKVVWDGEE